MSIIRIATQVAQQGMPIREEVRAAAAPPTDLQKLGEQLTKYVPTEVVGIVTGAYALTVSYYDGHTPPPRAGMAIVILGFLCLLGLYWLQLVAQIRQTDKATPPLSIAIRKCAAVEFFLLSACYAAWALSLFSASLGKGAAFAAGLATIVLIHLIDPFRKAFVRDECSQKGATP